MQALLPVFSSLAILLLIIIIPGQLKSNTIPAISIICWLFVCNLIHAANSIAWADNATTHAPVWCDISTKILLGAMVAVPGALFCISRQLEVLTSRFDHAKMPSLRYKTIIESTMCIVIPVLYMSLHTIVQFRRFSILENFGCQPAVHDSLPGLILVWLPPFLISALAFLYNCSAAFNITKSHFNSVAYFPSTPELSLSLFIRRLAFATAAVLYTSVAYAIVLSWSSANLLPWTSVFQVHSQFSQIEIIQPATQLAIRSELIWWSIPVWTFLLSLLSAFGEETKKGYRTIWIWIAARSRKATLPLHLKRPQITIPATPVSQIQLRSQWDVTLSSGTTIKLKGSASISSLSPTSPVDDDASFTQSTLNYLDSDAARQLQLPSPPPVTVSHYRNQTFASPTSPSRTETPPRPSSPPTSLIERKSIEVYSSRPAAEELAMPRSRTSSILSASAWPQPPPSPPSMHPYALSIAPQQSPMQQHRTISPAPSFSSDTPFQGPSIMATPYHTAPPRRTTSARSGKGKARMPHAIQMTVMRETIVAGA